MWAIGAILAELFTLFPIFPGESESDQLFKICCVLGTPDWTILPEGMNLPSINFSSSEVVPVNLLDIIPNASMEAIDLIIKLCSWDPRKRPTAEQALQHPFFHVGMWVPHPLVDPFVSNSDHNEGAKPKLELSLWDFGTESDDCFLGLTLAVKPSVPNLAMVHQLSHNERGEIVFCSGFQDHSDQSVWWSVPSPNHNGNSVPAMSSFPPSYFANSQISGPANGLSHSEGSNYSSFESNFLARPLMAMPSPFQQGHFFE
ncbi:hypothetical protein AQUCO_03400071v1 [Aquilegia coerulea]|nr:hypothetical protein AQUCO_03400071v1 [Aquilegia coerulea]